MTNPDRACLLISLVSGSPSHIDNVICLSPLSSFNSSHYPDICHYPLSVLLLFSFSWWWLLQCETQIIDINSLFGENNSAPDSIMMGGGEGVIITLPAHHPRCPLMMTLNSQHHSEGRGGCCCALNEVTFSALSLGASQADCVLGGNRRSVPWQPWQVFADTLSHIVTTTPGQTL